MFSANMILLERVPLNSSKGDELKSWSDSLFFSLGSIGASEISYSLRYLKNSKIGSANHYFTGRIDPSKYPMWPPALVTPIRMFSWHLSIGII